MLSLLLRYLLLGPPSLGEHDDQDDRQDHRDHHQQVAEPLARGLLVALRLHDLLVGLVRVVDHHVHLHVRSHQLLALILGLRVDLTRDLIDLGHDVLSHVKLLLSLVNDLLLEVGRSHDLDRVLAELLLLLLASSPCLQVAHGAMLLGHFQVHLLSLFDLLYCLAELLHPVAEVRKQSVVLGVALVLVNDYNSMRVTYLLLEVDGHGFVVFQVQLEFLHYLLDASNFVLYLLSENHTVRVSAQLLRLHTKTQGLGKQTETEG